jgi:uncharacterized protein (UPF0147 family)
LIASFPIRKEKKEKDLKQVCAVAKKIITEETLMVEVRRLMKNLPSSWRNKIEASALSLAAEVVDCKVDFSKILATYDKF